MRFQAFLYPVRAGDRCGDLPLCEYVLHLPRKGDDENGDRKDPQRSERHLPIVDEEPDRDDAGTDDGRRELGVVVREGTFDNGAVVHDRRRKIGQVSLPEKGEGELAHALCKRDAPRGAFFVSVEIIAVILYVIGDIHQNERGEGAEAVQPVVEGERCAFVQERFQKVGYKQKQQAGGQHFEQVDKNARRDRLDVIDCALFGKGVPFHEILDHAFASFATFHSAAD